jgi:hypothetical protein
MLAAVGHISYSGTASTLTFSPMSAASQSAHASTIHGPYLLPVLSWATCSEGGKPLQWPSHGLQGGGSVVERTLSKHLAKQAILTAIVVLGDLLTGKNRTAFATADVWVTPICY